MGKALSITVHPSELGAEYLSVEDAMRQILDLIEALQHTEAASSSERQIVWRLTNAHTNSPPLTVTAEAFPVDPVVSIGIEAARVTAMFVHGLRELLDGRSTDWLDRDVAAPLKRALQRNVNGVGRTEITADDEEPFNIVPSNARLAVVVLDRLNLDAEAAIVEQSRTEFGAVEVEIRSIARWNDRPALVVIERLSREKVTCVLSQELASQLGPHHKWDEAWEGRRLLVGGALYYGHDGSLKRIEADSAEDMPWTDVTLADLKDIDILQGRSVEAHLRLIRGTDLG